MPNQQQLTKVPDLWFEDGNLIIIAGNMVFRLYQGLLKRRSRVFKEILAPSHQDGTTATDATDQCIIDTLGPSATGCAVVRLADKAKDLEWFLAALLSDNATSWTGATKYAGSVAALAGILRLATKYDVAFLRSGAAAQLLDLLPVDENSLRRDVATKGPNLNIDGHLSLISMAKSTNVTWLLPRVYWRLHHVPLIHILKHPEWAELSDSARSALLVGRECAREVGMDMAGMLLMDSDKNVIYKHDEGRTCAQGLRDRTMRVIFDEGVERLYGGDSIQNSPLKSYLESRSCLQCRKSHRHFQSILLTGLFNLVQKAYGLPNAAQLTNLRNQYFKDAGLY